MKKIPLSIATLLFVFSAQATNPKYAIQISTDDARTQKIVLNNAANLQKYYGADNVIVEIVAYGPGLGILTPKNKNASRVGELQQQGYSYIRP
jgi:intracellular sulfur oxidation DsrE/DsrF family protein